MDNDSRHNGNASTPEFRGCNTSDMVVIHRMFRRQFHRLHSLFERSSLGIQNARWRLAAISQNLRRHSIITM